MSTGAASGSVASRTKSSSSRGGPPGTSGPCTSEHTAASSSSSAMSGKRAAACGPRTAPSRLHGRMATVRSHVLATLVLSFAFAACSGSPVFAATNTVVPLATRTLLEADLSTASMGWVPVAYGDAQVSVPASFSSSIRDRSRLAVLCAQPGPCFLNRRPRPGQVPDARRRFAARW